MSNSAFIGKSHELDVARELTENHIVVSFPLVDIGVDLLASSRDFTRTVPVQVKFKQSEKNLFLAAKDINRYERISNLYLVYVLSGSRWYMPFEIWREHAMIPPERKDGAGFVVLQEKGDKLSQYAGDQGLMNMIKQINSE